jgi:hypothetical protein
MGDPTPLQQEVADDSAKPEGLLYHYTDQKGLSGMLGKQEIWATHVLYLNDASELRAAWDKCWAKTLQELRSSGHRNAEKIVEVCSNLERVLWPSLQSHAYYVWCLTDDASATDDHHHQGDRLSQWRGYSAGTFGYSLGFDFCCLENDAFVENPIFKSLSSWSGPCNYDEGEQNTRIDALAKESASAILCNWDEYWNHLRNQSVSGAENRRNNMEHLSNPLKKMYICFVKFARFTKHPGFSEEREWRYIFMAESQSAFSIREGQFGLTPYLAIGIKLSTPPSPLKRIVVGPNPHMDEAVGLVRMMLEKESIHDVEVVPSKIPYRNW